MQPIEIAQLATSLGVIVVSIVIGLTGAFKKFFPTVEPMAFSLPAGAVITVLAWFATQPVPEGVGGWASFALVVIIGGLMPSGLFDAGVNMLRKGGVGGMITNFTLIDEGPCGCEGDAVQ